jgi:hypothetical protein
VERLGRADVGDQQRHRAGAEVHVGFLQRHVEVRARHRSEHHALIVGELVPDLVALPGIERLDRLRRHPVVLLRGEGVEHVGGEILQHDAGGLVEDHVEIGRRRIDAGLEKLVPPRHGVAVAIREPAPDAWTVVLGPRTSRFISLNRAPSASASEWRPSQPSACSRAASRRSRTSRAASACRCGGRGSASPASADPASRGCWRPRRGPAHPAAAAQPRILLGDVRFEQARHRAPVCGRASTTSAPWRRRWRRKLERATTHGYDAEQRLDRAGAPPAERRGVARWSRHPQHHANSRSSCVNRPPNSSSR